jgi:hypothetical protein
MPCRAHAAITVAISSALGGPTRGGSERPTSRKTRRDLHLEHSQFRSGDLAHEANLVANHPEKLGVGLSDDAGHAHHRVGRHDAVRAAGKEVEGGARRDLTRRGQHRFEQAAERRGLETSRDSTLPSRGDAGSEHPQGRRREACQAWFDGDAQQFGDARPRSSRQRRHARPAAIQR